MSPSPNDAVPEQLAAKMLGCSLAALQRRVEVEEINDQRMVRLGSMLGLKRVSRFTLTDAERYADDPSFLTETEQCHWVPLLEAADTVGATTEMGRPRCYRRVYFNGYKSWPLASTCVAQARVRTCEVRKQT